MPFAKNTLLWSSVAIVVLAALWLGLGLAFYLGSPGRGYIAFTDPRHPADQIQFALSREPRWPQSDGAEPRATIRTAQRLVWYPLHTLLHRLDPGRSTRIVAQGTPQVHFVPIATAEARDLYQEHLRSLE